MSTHSVRATQALQKLAEVDPALAALSLWCDHRDNQGPHDLAWTDGKTIFYAPGFLELSLPEQMGLCAHHILHIAFRHVPRSKTMETRFGDRFAPEVYNAAADAILNDALDLAGYALPRPSVGLAHLMATRPDLPGTPAEALARYDADTLYVALMTGGGAGDAAKITQDAGEAGYAEDLDRTGTVPDEETESQQAAEWRERVVRAMEEGRLAGRGIGALGFRLADLPDARTPWEVLLRRALAKAVQPDARLTYRRPARNWLAAEAAARARGVPIPPFQPAVLRDRRVPHVVTCIDTSSSIDPGRLGLFAAEIAGMARRTDALVTVLVFDDTVHGRTELGPGNWESAILGIAFARDGGTSFVEPVAEAARLDPSMIVIFTDLDGPFGPPPGRVPVLWCTPAASAMPPFGDVLVLDR